MATSALSGLDVARTRKYSHGGTGMFDSALLVDRDGRELIIRVPMTQSAETEQSADLVALRALTVGNRSRLPFDVPQFVGQTPASGTRAIVYELLPGDSFDADALTSHAGVAGSLGRAIAAVHALPTAFIQDAGLPQQSAQDCRTGVIDLIDRAAATGFLPAALLRRWEQATDDDALWQFAPCVVHGSLSADSILITDDAVSGVLGWAGLSVNDPARDLHWLLAARGQFAETAMETYITARQGGDAHIVQRAMLYAELELARWLLHGVDSHDQAVIDDAIGMLDGLVGTVHDRSSHPLSPETGPIMTVRDVESMLDEIPVAARGNGQHTAMHTDTYDAAEFAESDFADSESGSEAFRDATGFTETETHFDTETETPAATAQRTDGAGVATGADADAHAARRSSSE
ncbi:phosphotransferase [Cryobacterium melibiosiphilum]|uniref:phosphotransferase n=1 Tax=Cryobacterium melibiosiphilum TaxID=995039 RepID=UPI00361C8413